MSEATTTGPECYIRINVTKNSKGYSYETTASVRWTGESQDGAVVLESLLAESDRMAREEIAQRESLDEVTA